MKANVDNQKRTSRTDKQLLRLILELEILLNKYRSEGNPYDQDRTSEIQAVLTALEVLTIRILNGD